MGWELQPVTYRQGAWLHTVTAQVRGEWCLHPIGPRPVPPGGWRVTHTLTGINIIRLADDLSERDARRIVTMLDRRIPTLDIEHVLSTDAELRRLSASDMGRLIEAVVAEALEML